MELQELLEAHIVDFTCISEFRSDIETLEKVACLYLRFRVVENTI